MFYSKLNKYKFSIFTLTIILISSGIHSKLERTILILGDSIGAGYGIPSENRWTSTLQDLLDSTNTKVNLINASVSGDTTQVDLPAHTRSGLNDAVTRLKHINGFCSIRLSDADIVRHRLVQDIVRAYDEKPKKRR